MMLRMMPGMYEILSTAQHAERHNVAQYRTARQGKAPQGTARRRAAELGPGMMILRIKLL